MTPTKKGKTGRGGAGELDPVWRALGSPVRREILDILRKGPKTTGEISKKFPDLSRFSIMQHLGVLAEGNLVIFRRRGRQRINYLNPIPISQIHDRWVSRFEKHWTQALIALKEDLEEDVASPASKQKGAA